MSETGGTSGSGYEGGEGFAGAPEAGRSAEIPSEVSSELGFLAINGPELSPEPENASQLMHEVLESNYYALQDRIESHPLPSTQELAIGAFIEEIQPQAREAVLAIWQKGYDIGNALHAGFDADYPERQVMTLDVAPLAAFELTILNAYGFTIEDGRLSFQPDNQTDLGSMKESWDWLAEFLPSLESPAQTSVFGNAEAFREAAANGTLLDYYLPGGNLDPIGVKYTRERDPLADLDLGLSPDAASAVRELTFIDQYHELRDRLANNPQPTPQELNMGAYIEQIEPQLRDAVASLRQKGYNTGSSGFWGEARDQAMDISTPIDDTSRARLAEINVEVTEMGIRFTPENPSNLPDIKAKWDFVATILPDLGQPAEAKETESGAVFRHATLHGKYADFLEAWTWQMGALTGEMQPLTITMLNEGYSFGSNVHTAAQLAATKFNEMSRLSKLD